MSGQVAVAGVAELAAVQQQLGEPLGQDAIGRGAEDRLNRFFDLAAGWCRDGTEDVQQALGQFQEGLLAGVDEAWPHAVAVNSAADEVFGKHGVGVAVR